MAERTQRRKPDEGLGPLAELQLDGGPKPDRLPPMLFLAALLHGILIIGITFNAIVDDANSESVSLEVTIVADPDRNVARDEPAEYLAQASQQGGGNTLESARPSAPAKSSVPVDNAGVADAADQVDASHTPDSADQRLSSRSVQDDKVRDKPRENPVQDELRAARLEAGADTTLPLPQDERANFLVRDKNRQRIVLSADTRQSGIAGYVDSWKRKIEAVGSRYIPEQQGLRGLRGSPTLEVTISASGQLADVVIVRSSGSRAIDQAALSILRRAAPFDPFPEAVRLDHDELNFLYKWQFTDREIPATASLD
ncbi:MAG TPA: TonB family protein [Woeseiaceae bacterium]|nr:TonB family protein [Woeseiaceae bacterium]